MNADPDQRRAIEWKEGPALVLAGPGSGKTTVLVERLRFLIGEGGIPPESIMVITFTRAAAAEMKDRFYKLLISEGNFDRPNITFGTFHSIFLSVLKTHRDFRDFTIISGKKKYVFLRECARSLSLLTDERAETFDLLSGDISCVKNGKSAPEEPKCGLTKADFLRLFALYEDRKRKYGLMDFDDMLTLALSVFREDKAFLQRLTDRFTYFLVDEAQDMNALQYEAMRLLGGGKRNIFLVGDDDQSIYSFRGADPAILKTFTEDYPEAAVIRIRSNYRCAEKIVNASSRLISSNTVRFAKKLQSKTGVTGEITLSMHRDEEGECAFLVGYLQRFLADEKNGGRNIGILVRHRAEAFLLLDALTEAGLPYYSSLRAYKGGGADAGRFIFEDVSAYLRLACSDGIYRRRDILAIMNTPDRSIPRYGLFDEEVSPEAWTGAFAEDPAARERVEDFLRSLSLLHTFSAGAAVRYLLKGMNYEKVIEEALEKSPMKKKEIRAAKEELLALAGSVRRNDELLAAIEKHVDDCDRAAEAADRQAETEGARIFVYTYHGSKGLQFSEVLLPSVNETIVPSKKARDAGEIEEERRMFYVALTRAKEKVLISVVKKHGKDDLPPSRFLYEMKDQK